ncbi:hypothetical protein I7I53_07507 [Histoplasma capsulatum var. duboisii H88]|uniref:Uncharacterized protein n=1 Tax=Ajellomyces capsulatus (strain H88) TaxID=544711 RepID=A0A8A1LH87_AJEC8|nr:hypothetical protein I7I53_07507 [Histoplasma capsulatum var. duboisii H88]
MSKSHNRISDGDSSERQVVFWAHSSHFTEPWQSLCTNGLKFFSSGVAIIIPVSLSAVIVRKRIFRRQ